MVTPDTNSKNTSITPNIKDLEKAFDGNLDLMLFYLTWVKCGLNASKAYKELHPDVDAHSARVLGSRSLAKVNKEMVMQAYGLNHEAYFRQLSEGLLAQRSDMTGQTFPDHRTRALYHDKLGKLLGIEVPGGIDIGELHINIINYAKPNNTV